MTIDKQNRIWFIEPASFDFKHTRVSAFDLTSKKQVEFFEFPEGQAQFAGDIRVKADGKYVAKSGHVLLRPAREAPEQIKVSRTPTLLYISP